MIDCDKFPLNAFLLLGIERILYAFWYIYPNSFKAAVRQGTFGEGIQVEPLYWKAAMTLGKYVKIFQFSVVGYDLLYRCDIGNPFSFISHETSLLWDNNSGSRMMHYHNQVALGVLLMAIGQGLNIAVFNALGAKGVYYGYEFGYSVPHVKKFPYNVRWLSDPQYWGVILTIFGIYTTLDASSYVVPVLETFWYVMSMKILEHERGRIFFHRLLGKDDKKIV